MKSFVSVFVIFTIAHTGISYGKTAPDNTKINERDTSIHEVTSDKQGNSKSDLEITRMIRKDLMNDKSLSLYAHNVKIITVNGKVTLKGPVRSKLELKKIMKTSKKVAGASRVVNKMAVTE